MRKARQRSTEVTGLSGPEGNLTVSLTRHPRYVDPDKCIACGLCAEKCPKKVIDEYNDGLGKRKAIYVPYSQAVPLKYAIDPESCLYLTRGRCGTCETVCPSGAINYQDKPENLTLQVGSVILATGFDATDVKGLDYLAFGTHPDVVTSLGFERVLSATGPWEGHLVLPSDKSHTKAPKKIAWLQCVGSREENRCANGYCSSVCCMIAIKQAVMARDHSTEDLDCAIFYMDMRTQGKDFDQYLEKAKKDGVRFVRSRVHSVLPEPDDTGILMSYITDSGEITDEHFDMVVLSTGLQINASVKALADKLDIELDPYHFINTTSFNPVATSRQGVYACGVFTGPKDIPQSVMEASAASCAATEKLAVSRNSLTRLPVIPDEKDVTGQPPRIGVFICKCGSNIAGVVDVSDVAAYAGTLKRPRRRQKTWSEWLWEKRCFWGRFIRHVSRSITQPWWWAGESQA